MQSRLVQSLTIGLVEKMNRAGVRDQHQGFSWPDRYALTEPPADLLSAQLGNHLRFGTHGLDHYNFGGNACATKREMLGPDAVDGGLSIRACGRPAEWQAHAFFGYE